MTRRSHRIQPMLGRDPHEDGRTATTLELLFDLVFVVAIGQAANQLAHLVGHGHFAAGGAGFAFSMFAVLWGWVNFSWFASAFDTDDWAYRLATMVQMVGVTILGLGLPAAFRSLDAGAGIDSRVVVAGYVIMRVAMVFLWLRAARQSPKRRAVCVAYAKFTALAQVGWVATTLLPLPPVAHAPVYVALMLVEMAGPYFAEKRLGGTPWHAHHIAERYGLLAIIALGEGVIGTVASLSAVVEVQGWTTDAVLVAVAGVGLTFAMWWCYFLVPAGEVLHAHRERSFAWGYGSLVVIAAIAATGAGLHVAGLYLEHEAHIGPVAVVLALAIPVGVYLLALYLVGGFLLADLDPFHVSLLAVTAVVLAAAPLLAAGGASMTVCLLVVMAAPVVNVLGFELRGHRRQAALLGETSEK